MTHDEKNNKNTIKTNNSKDFNKLQTKEQRLSTCMKFKPILPATNNTPQINVSSPTENKISPNSIQNKTFTPEEEVILFKMLLDNTYFLPNEHIFSETVIHRLAEQLHNNTKHYRKTRPFKASVGWIIEFRRRIHVYYYKSKWFYRKWEIISNSPK